MRRCIATEAVAEQEGATRFSGSSTVLNTHYYPFALSGGYLVRNNRKCGSCAGNSGWRLGKCSACETIWVENASYVDLVTASIGGFLLICALLVFFTESV